MGIEFIDEENCSEAARAIIKFVNCPHRIISQNNTIEDINAEYDKTVIRGKNEGFVPVFVSADEALAELFSDGNCDYSEEKIFEDFNREIKSSTEFLEEQCKKYFEDYDEDYEDYKDYKQYIEYEECDDDDEDEYADLLTFSEDEIILFEIPVKNPWEVIAWIPFGGWNECPAPVEMMAICKYWYEEYKAVPAAISHDTLEFILEEPISDEEIAWEIAKQHCIFCSDCIESDTLSEITYDIVDSKIWYFWWD